VFMPDEVPRVCDLCLLRAKILVYNRTKKIEEFFCEKCAPPVGTPRIRRLEERETFWIDRKTQEQVLAKRGQTEST